jgi:hypothetical protein
VWKFLVGIASKRRKKREAMKQGHAEAGKQETGAPPLDACSNCAGDYEDPERTTEEAEEEKNDSEDDELQDE